MTKRQKQNELIFYETDVWELSGLPLESIQRKFVTVNLRGKSNFKIRVATIGQKSEATPTLVLCHDYMLAGCI